MFLQVMLFSKSAEDSSNFPVSQLSSRNLPVVPKFSTKNCGLYL